MRTPLSKKIIDIQPSGIRKFFDVANEMEDAISLGVGEPDFDTPWRIREEGIFSLERGRTFYTSNAGLKELREEICRYMEMCIRDRSYRQSLLLDLYMRENAKRRPCFAQELQITKEETRKFYEKEAQEFRYLKGYEQYDRMKIRKMTHLYIQIFHARYRIQYAPRYAAASFQNVLPS